MSGVKSISFRINAISRWHAEINALRQLYEMRQGSGRVGGCAEMVVDQPPCPACLEKGGIRSAVRAAQLDQLKLTWPGGSTIIKPFEEKMVDKRQLWLGADIPNPRWDHKKIKNDPVHLYGILIPDPDWQDVEVALRTMDGEKLNEVYLELSDDNALMAGGGNGGRYVVAHFPDNSGATSFMLADLSQHGPPVELTVSQASEYPAEWCVRLPLVLKAFELFFRTGQRSKDERWEPDDYRT